jgi:hypothetical protein
MNSERAPASQPLKPTDTIAHPVSNSTKVPNAATAAEVSTVDPQPSQTPASEKPNDIAASGRDVNESLKKGIVPDVTATVPVPSVPSEVATPAEPPAPAEPPQTAQPATPHAPAPAAAAPIEPAKPTDVAVEPPKPRKIVPDLADLPKKAGPIAVFISRKDKKLYVRQGFAPLFDLPVTIADASAPFGTHVFTAMEPADAGAAMRWTVISLPAEPSRQAKPAITKTGKKAGKKLEPAPKPVSAPLTAAEVLDRIEIPPEAVERIGQLLAPGSSLVVSDYGLGNETGKGTDFIVVTR